MSLPGELERCAMSGKSDYAVGHGRPPKHSQFKKGQSGNPKGRPKNADRELSILEEICSALSEKVTIEANGKRQKVTKQKLLVTNLVNTAIKGNMKATSLLLRLDPGSARRSSLDKEEYEIPDALAEELTQQFVSEYQAAARLRDVEKG